MAGSGHLPVFFSTLVNMKFPIGIGMPPGTTSDYYRGDVMCLAGDVGLPREERRARRSRDSKVSIRGVGLQMCATPVEGPAPHLHLLQGFDVKPRPSIMGVTLGGLLRQMGIQ